MCALELGAVPTSDNRQQWHYQLQWAWSKPSPITMGMINTIIMSHKSAHKMSSSNTMRKAVAISLEATRRACQQKQQVRCEDVMRRQLLSQEHQAQQMPPLIRRHPKWETSGRLGKSMPQISCNECGIKNKTCKWLRHWFKSLCCPGSTEKR